MVNLSLNHKNLVMVNNFNSFHMLARRLYWKCIEVQFCFNLIDITEVVNKDNYCNKLYEFLNKYAPFGSYLLRTFQKIFNLWRRIYIHNIYTYICDPIANIPIETKTIMRGEGEYPPPPPPRHTFANNTCLFCYFVVIRDLVTRPSNFVTTSS